MTKVSDRWRLFFFSRRSALVLSVALGCTLFPAIDMGDFMPTYMKSKLPDSNIVIVTESGIVVATFDDVPTLMSWLKGYKPSIRPICVLFWKDGHQLQEKQIQELYKSRIEVMEKAGIN